MKNYQKEIILSIVALLLLIFAVVAFLKVVNMRKADMEFNVYTLIPPNTEAILAVNRPDLLQRMVLSEPVLYWVFASEIPDVYLSIIKKQQIRSAVISFHKQGILCCIQAESGGVGDIEKLLREMFKEYTPQKQTIDGIDFHYLPDTDNRFFGYYIYNGIWVGSYSRKLLERAAEQQLKGEVLLSGNIRRLLESVDKNSPANIILPASKVGIDVSAGNGKYNWLAADLFVSEGNFCCYTHLPYFDDNISNAILSLLAQRYPQLYFSFQISSDKDTVSLTACSPLRFSD